MKINAEIALEQSNNNMVECDPIGSYSVSRRNHIRPPTEKIQQDGRTPLCPLPELLVRFS